jgi:hypothetical protein
MRAEDQRPVTGIQKRFAKKLLENLGSRTDHHVSPLGGDVKLVAHEPGGRFTELGKPWRGTVVRLVIFDGLLASLLGVGRAGKRAVANFQFNHILPLRLKLLGDGQDREGGLDIEVAGELAERHRHGRRSCEG